MCGFAGRINLTRSPIKDIRSAAAPLSFRGPDDWRLWRSDGGTVELIHARLSITDPDDRASQPFVGDKAQHVLAFNGEVYNHRQLRGDLPWASWRTDSDTEVLAKGLEIEGLRFFPRIAGTYSGVWINTQARIVHLFRDPVGKKPLLLWHDRDGSVLFGSSLRALLAIRSEPGEIRESALHEVLEHGYCEPTAGIYRGLRHIPPGTVVKIGFDGRILSEERIAIEPTELYDGEGFQQVQSSLGRLLEQAVERRLENNPHPAALLSGGIDSTIVTHVAARILRQRGQELLTYSINPVVPGSNDSRYARLAARRIGVKINWVSFPRRELSDRITASLDRLDEPLGMISYFLMFELVRAIAPHSRILLTGDGGDEVFCGYGAPRDWRRAGDADEPGDPEVQVGPALPGWFSPWAKRCAATDLFGHGFAKVDRASAEQGVEIRGPLLDLDLIAYTRSLPPEIIFHDDKPKGLLKSMLGGWPQSFVNRPKLGLAYNLRWQWLASNFEGLREQIDPALIEALWNVLPSELRAKPEAWAARQIFRYFPQAYALLAMSVVIGNLGREVTRNDASYWNASV